MMVWRRRKHVSFATLWIVFAVLCLQWASYRARSWCLLSFLPLNLTANYRLVCSIKRLRSGRRGDSTLSIVCISGARVDKPRGIWNHVKRRLSSGRINYIELVSNERHEMKKKTHLNFSSLVFTLNKWIWERATMTMKKCFDSRSSGTRSECVILTLCTPNSRQVFACLLRAAITCELSRLNQSASIWLGENFHMRRSSYDRRSEM